MQVIAYLDTGGGKTLIAVLLVREKVDEVELAGRKKHIFFVTPKVSLVKQQAGVLCSETGFAVGEYWGDMGVDFWQQDRWQQELDKQDVMVCTPQILLNILGGGFVKMCDIALIVFDECHHAKKGEPMNRIMCEYYFETPKGERPHILGLTASPLDTKAEHSSHDVKTFYAQLEDNLDAKIITVKDQQDVQKAAPLPTLEQVHYGQHDAAILSHMMHAQELLNEVHAKLLCDADIIKGQWQRISWKRVAETSQMLDDENYTSETATFARTLGNIIHILQELGVYCAVMCLVEVLKPRASNIYEEMARVANGATQCVKDPNMYMAPQDTDKDTFWWEGGDNTQQHSTQAVVGEHEGSSLCNELIRIYHVFADLLLALGEPGLPFLSEAAESTRLQWAELRTQTRQKLEAYKASLSKEGLSSQLISSPHSVASGSTLFTPKAAALVQYLASYELVAMEAALLANRSQQWSCIIFAQRKLTVLALHLLLAVCRPTLAFLASAPLMGYGGRVAVTSHKSEDQHTILNDFRKGKLNALVATAVAEEGLDISHCSLVIRFDLPPTTREFIQSRGRARAPGSRMALMMEAGNPAHKRLVDASEIYEKQMLKEARRRAELGYESNDSEGEVDEEDRSGQHFRVPSTGAKVTLSSAKSLLFHYCAKLPSDKYVGTFRPRFSTERQDTGFRSVAFLPITSPVQKATGQTQQRKALAVASACLEAIRLLHQAKALTDNLVPDPDPEEVEDDEKPEYKLGPKGSLQETEETYLTPVEPKVPDVLKRHKQQGDEYFLYRIAFTDTDTGLPHTYRDFAQPLGIVVPNELPELPSVPTTLDKQKKWKVTIGFQALGRGSATPEQQAALVGYHDWMVQRKIGQDDVLGLGRTKKKLPTTPQVPKAPSAHSASPSIVQQTNPLSIQPKKETTNVENGVAVGADGQQGIGAVQEGSSHAAEGVFPAHGALLVPLIQQGSSLALDWHSLKLAGNFNPLLDLLDEDLEGRMILPPYLVPYDQIDNNPPLTRFRFMGLRPDLSLDSIMPADTAGEVRASKKDRGHGPQAFADYYSRRWYIAGLRQDQPMVQATWIRSNTNKESPGGVLLAPEAWVLHPLSEAAYNIAEHAMSALWWLHGLLQAHEVLQNLSPPEPIDRIKLPSVMSILEAVMPRNCEKHISYERLEVIGDAFLKYDVTLYAFLAHLEAHEGQLHNVKVKLICNKHLGWLATKGLRLHHYIALNSVWYSWETGAQPPGLNMRKKVLADMLEALIGAFFMAGGEQGAHAFLRRIKLLPSSAPISFQPPTPPAPLPMAAQQTTYMMEKLQRLLGYCFREPRLLKEACTHASWGDTSSPCYQRLEVLGDAVLDILVTQEIGRKYSDIDPGKLTDIRSAAVNNVRLACVAAAYRLHHALRHFSQPLRRDIADFVERFDEVLNSKIAGQEVAGLLGAVEERASNAALSLTYDQLTDESFGLGLAAAPKVLADMVESLTGAIFIDSGNDLTTTWNVMRNMLEPLPIRERVAIHIVRMLIEKAAMAGYTLKYKVTKREDKTYDVEAMIWNNVIGSAEGAPSSKIGKITAARDGMKKWPQDEEPVFKKC